MHMSISSSIYFVGFCPADKGIETICPIIKIRNPALSDFAPLIRGLRLEVEVAGGVDAVESGFAPLIRGLRPKVTGVGCLHLSRSDFAPLIRGLRLNSTSE